MTDTDRETQNTSHTRSLGSVTIITGTLEGILASSWFWFTKRATFLFYFLFLLTHSWEFMSEGAIRGDRGTHMPSHLRRWSFSASTSSWHLI